MKTNFYLKEPSSSGITSITLFGHYENYRLKFPTGQSIHTKDWSTDCQRAKKSHSGCGTLNNYLDKLEAALKDIYRDALAKKKNPSIEYLKNELNDFLNKKEDKEFTMLDRWNEYIAMIKDTKEHRTWQKYNTLYSNFLKVCQWAKIPMTFDNMKMPFYIKYREYRIAEKVSDETYYRELSSFKTFLSWALKMEYHTNMMYIKGWECPSKTDKTVYFLEEKELFKIYNHKFKNQEFEGLSLEKIKDAFCFSCFTGLRWSDVVSVR